MLKSLPQKGETVFGVRSDLIDETLGNNEKTTIKLKNQRINKSPSTHSVTESHNGIP